MTAVNRNHNRNQASTSTNSAINCACVHTISQHNFHEATTQYLDNASTAYYARREVDPYNLRNRYEALSDKTNYMNNEESSETDSNNTLTNGTAVTDYLVGNPTDEQQGLQANTRVKVTPKKSIKEPNLQRAPFRISIQQLDAYLGLVIAIIACGFIIPLAIILSFAINIAAPRAQSAIANILSRWEKGCTSSNTRAQKRLNGPVLPTTNMNGQGVKYSTPLAPTLLGEWVRSTTNVGRPKTVKINTCAPSAKQAPHETAVKFIENRPFVHGTLAACYTTDMLVDFGASTSVISRTAIAEIESILYRQKGRSS